MDDAFLPEWPGVTSALLEVLGEGAGDRLAPFLIGANKAFLCRPARHAEHLAWARRAVARLAGRRHRAMERELAGHRLVVLSETDWGRALATARLLGVRGARRARAVLARAGGRAAVRAGGRAGAPEVAADRCGFLAAGPG